MIDFKVFSDLEGTELSDFCDKPTTLTNGQQEASKELWVSADGKIKAGVWECTEGQFTADEQRLLSIVTLFQDLRWWKMRMIRRAVR